MQLAPPTISSRPSTSFFISLGVVFGLLAAFFGLLAACPNCGPGPSLLSFAVRILGGGNPRTRYSPRIAREPGSLVILPIGDSITFGYWSSGPFNAYRLHLINLLTGTTPIWSLNQTVNADAPFQDVRYIGGERSGNFSLALHEGHGGANIVEIQDFFNGAVQNYREAPDAVLLMAGTNDMIQYLDLPNAPGRLGDLIDTIYWRFPDTVMIVAGLTPFRHNETRDAVRVQYNRALPSLVERRRNNNWKILYTDLSEVVIDTDIADDTHPKDSGHAKMAVSFYDALLKAKDEGWFDWSKPA